MASCRILFPPGGNFPCGKVKRKPLAHPRLFFPIPVRDCVAMGKEGCHSRESGNPVVNFIQIFEILDARFRGHDKL
jgi:hypothetical protein